MEERIKKLEAQVEELTRANEVFRNKKNYLEGECNRLAGEVAALSRQLEATEQTKNTYYEWYKEEKRKFENAELMLTSIGGILSSFNSKTKM